MLSIKIMNTRWDLFNDFTGVLVKSTSKNILLGFLGTTAQVEPLTRNSRSYNGVF